MEKSILLLKIGFHLREFTSERALQTIMKSLRELSLEDLKQFALKYGIEENLK